MAGPGFASMPRPNIYGFNRFSSLRRIRALWCALWPGGVFVTLDCDEPEMPCALESVVRASLNPIIVVDDHGGIVDFNAAAEHAFGQVRGEMIGLSASDHIVQSPLHPEDRHRIRSFFTSRADGESAVR